MKITAFILFIFSSAVVGFAQQPVEEIEFVHAPSFFDETSIVLSKLYDGSVVCTVLSRPEVADEHGQRASTKIKELRITPDVYAQLSAALENPALRTASENLERVFDGTNWIFLKRKGGFKAQYRFSSPSERRGGEVVIELGHRFAAAAAMDELLAPMKEPNKALVPTVMSVTPAADAPVAPATTAAHL
jgi:hypothetical protein